MGRLLDIVTPLHKMTKRDYLARMVDDKVHRMVKAKEYEFDYWDGDRRYGYGGYRFIDGRWAPVAQALIDTYGLKDGDSILDVGCGKAFLLYEIKKLLPNARIAGFDISNHGLASALDDFYHVFMERRSAEEARLLHESLAASIDRIEQIVRAESIECDFARCDGYLFLGEGDEPDTLEKEIEACHRIGFDGVAWEARAPMPRSCS